MGTEFYLMSGDAQRALEDFSQDFMGAYVASDVEEWSKTYGLSFTSKALKTTYPIPLATSGFTELVGDLKYRELFQRSLSLMPKTWQDGVEELASRIEAPDFMGWGAFPAAMAADAKQLPNKLIATLLAANGTSPLDNLAFFHSAHLINPLDSSAGTFDNLISGAGTTPTAANVKLAAQYFRTIKSPGGGPGGYRLTHILAPSVWEEDLRDILEQALIIQELGTSFAAVDNRHRGRAKVIISDELTGTAWYPLSLNKPGAFPWVVQDEGGFEEIVNDKISDHYKRTLKVSVAHILRMNAALALPQCVQEWEGTA